MKELELIGKKAKQAAVQLARATTIEKNDALRRIAQLLLDQQELIINENQKDINNAKQAGVAQAIIDRLALTKQRIVDISTALVNLATLADPIGETLTSWQRPNGLTIKQVAVPIGVVGMIYEARPNVTVDAASLCLKTGNTVVLRGSSSSIHSNKAIVKLMQTALTDSNIPVDSIQLVEDTRRQTAEDMFKLNHYLDVLIPRGSKQLIDNVIAKASVPVLETGAGNCHIYLDHDADVEMALKLIINAKTQRPSVCNAIETVLVHEDWFDQHGLTLINKLLAHQVEIHGDQAATAASTAVIPATEEDWQTEYLDYKLALKTVTSTQQAIDHINLYGTSHSEAIISENPVSVDLFMREVDAACVYHNASTRFTDGFEFGFGAEIGISTQKLHARGPMGLTALTSSKYLILGNGQAKE
ncbi:glutamate-5-semialdehyde dehydrogenase [Amphibacillus marinus]|uniref:Gamma-glutamyl phosphate reductase n=1 Tax=Amphibacillus marinus TaxID=872970 RepID=A0A1H8GU32_9BACI|nr:glutamate-5-semialdehyde dehydrogenase [Amphibacillus marinus]SEN47234.1 glutamate-5-semialdehyde dehydrogenase [Amphibacillus marinus]